MKVFLAIMLSIFFLWLGAVIEHRYEMKVSSQTGVVRVTGDTLTIPRGIFKVIIIEDADTTKQKPITIQPEEPIDDEGGEDDTTHGHPS